MAKLKLPTPKEIEAQVVAVFGEPSVMKVQADRDGACLIAKFVFGESGEFGVSYEFPDFSQFPWTVTKMVMNWPCPGFGPNLPMAILSMKMKVREHVEGVRRHQEAVARYDFEADIAKVNAIEVA